jgi:hypothetical protein
MDLPDSDVVSPALLAALTRLVYQLQTFAEKYTEKLWKAFPAPFWNRQGPYLLLRAEEKTANVVLQCKKHGIIVSPDPRIPSIIPGIWTEGEVKFLTRQDR